MTALQEEERTLAPPAPSRFFCSVAAGDRDEPLFATASQVQRWVLVEQAGPWGPQSLPSSGLDADVLASVRDRARAAGARVLLVRRPDGTASPRRHVGLSDVRPGHERTLLRTVSDDDELADVALPWTGEPDAAWEEPDEPLLLICTHGRHDPCCAVRGRPVAKALAALRPGTTWECSHLGGDRFAANLLVLPRGLYLGRVQAADAEELLAGLAQDVVAPRWFRGRSAFPTVVQAAQHLAGTELGMAGLDQLAPLRPEEPLGDDAWRVTLDGGAGHAPVVVDLQRAAEADATRLTCHAVRAAHPPAYRLLALR